MNVDKPSLKRLVEQSKPNEILVLQVNPLEKNSLQSCQKEIDKFIKKQEDYVITVIKRQFMIKISPPYKSFINQEIYVKDNMEIKCGVVWGSTTIYVHSDSKLDSLKIYDPEIGISPFEIDGFESYDNELT